MQVHSEEATQVVVSLAQVDHSEFQFKTHPNINKSMFTSDSVLTLKNPDRPFPIGTALSILKWRWSSREESKVPLVINSWPSPSGDETYVNMDYEVNGKYELREVVISIPLPSGRQPSVNQVRFALLGFQ